MADQNTLAGHSAITGKYIIKWFEGPATLQVSISEDTQPSKENDTEGTYIAIIIQVRFSGKLK